MMYHSRLESGKVLRSTKRGKSSYLKDLTLCTNQLYDAEQILETLRSFVSFKLISYNLDV